MPVCASYDLALEAIGSLRRFAAYLEVAIVR